MRLLDLQQLRRAPWSSTLQQLHDLEELLLLHLLYLLRRRCPRT